MRDTDRPEVVLTESGADYCRSHHGVRNEDEHDCDFRASGDPLNACSTCGGTGLVSNGLPSNGPDECPDCDEGVSRCDLTPLLYAARGSA